MNELSYSQKKYLFAIYKGIAVHGADTAKLESKVSEWTKQAIG